MKLYKRQGFELDVLSTKLSKEFKSELESRLYLNSITFYSESYRQNFKENFKIYLSVNNLETICKTTGLTNFLKRTQLERGCANRVAKGINDYEANFPTRTMISMCDDALEIIDYLEAKKYILEDIDDDKQILKNINANFKIKIEISNKYLALLKNVNRLRINKNNGNYPPTHK